jgi:carbon monoxide dehydrogenase subunit G
MQFTNEFVVPVPPDQAWDALMDIERVAQCMPGATLLENDGERFSGRVKVKVGPMTVSYRGSAEFVEKDPVAHRAALQARGREERGAGTAGLNVRASLQASGQTDTRVQLLTDLDLTGKPAQFGRGILEEVGTAIIDQFADRLAQEVRGPGGSEGDSQATTTNHDDSAACRDGSGTSLGAGAESSGGPDHHRPTNDEALDLGTLAWPAVKRLAPVVLGLLGLVALARVMRPRASAPTVVLVYGVDPRIG